MKRIVFLLVLSLCSLAAWAYSFSAVAPTGQTLYYNIISTRSPYTVSVTYPGPIYSYWLGYTKPTDSLTIPPTVTYSGRTYSVTAIEDYAFWYCSSLTSLTIPNSVTTIGNHAFSSCSGLTILTIPNSVTAIGNSAFEGCSGLTSVAIPNSVTSIGGDAFEGCSGLTSVAIPNSVTAIGGGTFAYCSSLTSVTIPNSVTAIGNSAFAYCSGLISVTIPNSVTAIGNSAFVGCSGLTSVTIPNSVTSIGEGTFYDCSGLTSITIPNSVTAIGINAFHGCSGLISVTIPNSVTSIGGYAFAYCSGLTGITIPNSVTSIGERTFQECSGLTSVTIPNSVTSIGKLAFSSCSGLTSLTIPNSVTSIGEGAFMLCSGLTSLTIPNSVTSIGNYAFGYCSGLTSLVVASGNTVYDSRDNCNAIIETATNTLIAGTMNTTIPSSVTSIGSHAFGYCSGLISVTIPNSVTSIGVYAFALCSGLTSIIIPNSATSIGDYALAGCSGLTSVTIESDTPPSTGADVFLATPISSATIYVPCGAASTYSTVSPWSDFGTISEMSYTYRSDTVFAYGSYTYNGITYTESGTYTYTIANSTGCDSIVILHLTILSRDHYLTYSISNNTATITGHSDTLTANSVEVHNWPDLAIPRSITVGSTTYPVTAIGSNAFFHCSELTAVTIPNAVTAIGGNAFNGCTGLLDIYALGSSPATLGTSVFSSVPTTVNVHVPCGNLNTYRAAWAAYFNNSNYAEEFLYTADAVSDNSTMGSVVVTLHPDCSSNLMVAQAVPFDSYMFSHWQDGSTYNPRTIAVTSDTMLTAYFSVAGSPSPDTIYIHDTVTVNNYIHDTTIINNYIHDTVTVNNYIYDTVYVGDDTYHNLSVVSDNTARGLAAGNGRFPDGCAVEIAAIPIEGNRFVQWQDGNTENPRTVIVTDDMTFVATFEARSTEGISQVGDLGYTISSERGVVTVSGAAGQRVRIFDSVGRLLKTETEVQEVHNFQMPASGAYLIQVGDAPAQKVVVVR